jgi:uncharacterized membrane protein
MSSLLALVFDDPFTAEEARVALHRMGSSGLTDVDETALLAKQKNGRAWVSQDFYMTGKDRSVGHALGLVLAAVTGTVPLILLGVAAEQLVRKLTDNGITGRFIHQVCIELQPGTSTLFLLARSDREHRQKVIQLMHYFKPKLLESDLPRDLEDDIYASLEQVAKPSPSPTDSVPAERTYESYRHGL